MQGPLNKNLHEEQHFDSERKLEQEIQKRDEGIKTLKEENRDLRKQMQKASRLHVESLRFLEKRNEKLEKVLQETRAFLDSKNKEGLGGLKMGLDDLSLSSEQNNDRDSILIDQQPNEPAIRETFWLFGRKSRKFCSIILILF